MKLRELGLPLAPVLLAVIGCVVGASLLVHPRVEESNRSERVIVIFIDTLRADHLGAYGYSRPTSPAIDAFAKTAVVFDNARSVAPWTLESTRAFLTGRLPDWWDRSEPIQQRLRSAGWKTGFISANRWLSPQLGMDAGFDVFNLEQAATADTQLVHGLRFLGMHERFDTFLLLHLMDPHTPEKAPKGYQRRFAAEPPPSLAGYPLKRDDYVALTDPAGRQYLIDRYDDAIRAMDEQLAALLSRLDRFDIVVLLSDHGEELYDHGGYGHGHTLYDELLRVPLMIRAPGVAPRRVSDSVSLLDVAPTLLELTRQKIPAGLDGVSLVPLLKGSPAAGKQLAARTVPIGWPLLGPVQWGSVHDHKKYVARAAEEFLFDLKADPHERSNRLAGKSWQEAAASRATLARATRRETSIALRFDPTGANDSAGTYLLVRCRMPGGWARAWQGTDAQVATGASTVIDGEELVLEWQENYLNARQLYGLPKVPLPASLRALRCEARDQGAWHAIELKVDEAVLTGRSRAPLAEPLIEHSNRLQVSLAVTPVPPHDLPVPVNLDREQMDALRAIGYVGN